MARLSYQQLSLRLKVRASLGVFLSLVSNVQRSRRQRRKTNDVVETKFFVEKETQMWSDAAKKKKERAEISAAAGRASGRLGRARIDDGWQPPFQLGKWMEGRVSRYNRVRLVSRAHSWAKIVRRVAARADFSSLIVPVQRNNQICPSSRGLASLCDHLTSTDSYLLSIFSVY